MDLYNREIISYKIAERPNFMQIMKMLDDAFARIPDSPGIVLHSDQGWQYQMKQYQAPFKTERYYTEHVAQG